MRMLKNFMQGIDMLAQRLMEPQFRIVKNEWPVDVRQGAKWLTQYSPNVPFIGWTVLNKHDSWDEAHDYLVDTCGAHFNVT